CGVWWGRPGGRAAPDDHPDHYCTGRGGAVVMRETRMVTVGPAVLAFGLDWLPLLDEHPDRLARQLARHHRATHAVLSGSDQAAVGLAWLRGQRRSPLPYSGAKIFALLNPRGTV